MGDYDDALRSAKARERLAADTSVAAERRRQATDLAEKAERKRRIADFILQEKTAGFPTVRSVDIRVQNEVRTGLFRKGWANATETYVGWSFYARSYKSEAWNQPIRTEERLLLIDGLILRHRDYDRFQIWSVQDLPEAFARELDLFLNGHLR